MDFPPTGKVSSTHARYKTQSKISFFDQVQSLKQFRRSVVIGILLWSTTWYNQVKQHWPRLILGWVTVLVSYRHSNPACLFIICVLVVLLWLYLKVCGRVLALIFFHPVPQLVLLFRSNHFRTLITQSDNQCNMNTILFF